MGSILLPPVPIFTRFYESALQTITVGGLLTLAHGLGVEPRGVQLWLECATAEHGYVAGEHQLLSYNGSGSGSTRRSAIIPDATNVLVRMSNVTTFTSVAIKTTGAAAAITNANWRLFVRAWA